MTLNAFLDAVKAGESVSFQQTQSIIAENYHYQPTPFSNGSGDDIIDNPAGINEGSCKLFAFAQLHGLNEAQTLALFGDYYREVLDDPDGKGHRNIRNFIKYGWSGIRFEGTPLTLL
ncbi:MAG: HopJ type III effector protein [Gammaproteobacteria bacterium]